VVDFNVAADSAKLVSLDAPSTKSADGQRLSYRLVNPQERPLAVRVHEPGNTMLVGGDGKTGNYFAVRMAVPMLGTNSGAPSPPAPLAEGEGRDAQAIFLVDTSLSSGPQFPLWTKLMRAVLENNRDRIKQFAVLFFNVETFWWQEKYVANTPENVEALMQYADGLTLEGATDLGRALNEAAAPAWLKKAGQGAGSQKLPSQRPEMFMLSDGAGTWGEDRWEPMVATLKSAKSGPLFAYGPGNRRGRVRRGGRGGNRPGFDRPAAATLAIGRHRRDRRARPAGGGPAAVRVSRAAVVGRRALRAGPARRRSAGRAPAGRRDAHRAGQDRSRARF
jgi:hypothetical protein